jgi:glycosyltransferase involved in cell wall biosynthesis
VAGSISVSVVVASHARHLRLRWLLNALEDQTLPRERWEVVVVHDYDGATAARVLDGHPLTESGTLRHRAIAPGTGSPARQRNIGLRMARGELVAFTDDDCRPDGSWLAALVERAAAAPGRVVQGATRPEPLEWEVAASPHPRTLFVEPVGPFAQTANIMYPHALLARLGGFDEGAIAGEDVGLWMRARRAGAEIVGAPDAVVYHAIDSHTLPGIVRQNLKWFHLAYLVKQHPEIREDLKLRYFWDEEHLATAGALAAVLGARAHPLLLGLAAPYVLRVSRRRGPGARRRALALADLPGALVRQGAEVVVMAAASVRHRTLVL